MDKKSQLQRLRSAIIRKYFVQNWQEVWFFPPSDEVPGVTGFMGTDPIFFVSINPSFGTYPSKADLFYYRNLKKQGFQNAHLTDVFKVKCKNEDAKVLLENRKLLREMENILKKEIAIVRPKMIVGVGLSYEKLYRRIFEKYNVKLLMIPHYAPQFNGARKQKQFRNRLRVVRKALESTLPGYNRESGISRRKLRSLKFKLHSQRNAGFLVLGSIPVLDVLPFARYIELNFFSEKLRLIRWPLHGSKVVNQTTRLQTS